jgi:glycogen synthase
MNTRYFVAVYSNGILSGILSGCGRHKGTWDYDHSRAAAYKHAKQARLEDAKGLIYKVEQL